MGGLIRFDHSKKPRPWVLSVVLPNAVICFDRSSKVLTAKSFLFVFSFVGQKMGGSHEVWSLECALLFL